MTDSAAAQEWGVRFHDGSIARRWNGRTQEQRAREYLDWLRGHYTRDQFALVTRSGPDDDWREVQHPDSPSYGLWQIHTAATIGPAAATRADYNATYRGAPEAGRPPAS